MLLRRQPYDLAINPDDEVRVAWAAEGQVLLSVSGKKREGFLGKVRVQIDPSCRCMLQVL